MNRDTQRIRFRLFAMPCCQHVLCWVSPRLPNYCPECGSCVYIQLKSGDCTMADDDMAWLLTTPRRETAG